MSAREIAKGLTKNETLVIEYMTNGEYVQPLAWLADDAGVPLPETREIVRNFVNLGIAQFGHLSRIDEDLRCGSGYWLTPLGIEVRAILMEETNAD